MAEEEKETIQRAISRARNGVSTNIDELDSRLRTQLDPKTVAREYAPQIIAGGAVLGLVMGFGLPKVFRKLVTFGVPVAILAMTYKNWKSGEDPYAEIG
ncbi:MAG TPA: hypothetical protein VGF69_15990 [Thermoanaerobaculia bacterium]|jgi:uncharacterized membrane protein YebE (DUF533 family)